MRELSFSPDRAIEYILFLAERLGMPTIHEILKLRYFADKIHLSKYGFMASGDTYSAMQYGPVASNTYNILKAARGEQNRWIHPDFLRAVSGVVEIKGNYVVPLRSADTSLLSPADIECLNEALDRYGNMDFSARTNVSHDAAYDKAWAAASNDNWAPDMEVSDIAKTLDNAEEVLAHLNS